jgi:hypothetical protein
MAGYPDSSELNIRCETSEIPKRTQNVQVNNIRGHAVRQVTNTEYAGQLTLTFIETVDNKILKFLQSWREACYQTKTGNGNFKADTEAKIRLERLDTQNNPIYEYVLIGCLCQDTTDGATLSGGGGGGEAIKPELIVSYDYFEDQALV